MRVEPLTPRESLAGELRVALLLDRPPTAFKREQLVKAKLCEPRPRIAGRADLDAVVEPKVVDDVHADRRKVGIRNVSDPPATSRADPARRFPTPGFRAARETRTRKFAHDSARLRRHVFTVLAASDICADGGVFYRVFAWQLRGGTAVAEPIDAWWQRRQRTRNSLVPYSVGTYRTEWERYPVLIRQYHPDLNGGITLTQIPPAAEVFLVWQCDLGHVFVATPAEQRNRPGGQRRRSVWCPVCAQLANPPRIKPTLPTPPPSRAAQPSRKRMDASDARLPGDAFWSAAAPKPASAAEADLRQRLELRFDFDLECNAVAVARPFFDRLEVWPDIVIPELRVAVEYDTVGRDGLEHVGRREESDRRKDRALRAVRWEVIRIRCGKLQPLGPYDLTASGITGRLIDRLAAALGAVRGELIVSAYRRR
jgi:hypothetical protein